MVCFKKKKKRLVSFTFMIAGAKLSFFLLIVKEMLIARMIAQTLFCAGLLSLCDIVAFDFALLLCCLCYGLNTNPSLSYILYNVCNVSFQVTLNWLLLVVEGRFFTRMSAIDLM